MNVGSLFTGIGGFDLGLERAGHRVVFQCERDEYRRRVLARHWPGIPCYADVRAVCVEPAPGGTANGGGASADGTGRDDPDAISVDLLCGGFPCQDLSVAGRRAGLAGERSGLFFEFARVADALLGPGGFVLIENVPGLLSSHRGRDFAVLLATLAELGFHDLAWRVLDSRHFGVPQRRRRVYVLGRRARGRVCAEVLLEPEGGGGDSAAGGEAGPRVASSLTRGSSAAGVSAPGRRQEDDENIVNALDRQRGGADDNSAQGGHLVAPALVRRYGKGTDSDATDALIAHTLTSDGFDASEDGTGRGTPLTLAGTLGGGNHGAGRRSEFDPNLVSAEVDSNGVRAPSGLPRRLDGGVTVPFDPKPDGPRYAACGDAITVSVAEWIGRRILEHEEGRAA